MLIFCHLAYDRNCAEKLIRTREDQFTLRFLPLPTLKARSYYELSHLNSGKE